MEMRLFRPVFQEERSLDVIKLRVECQLLSIHNSSHGVYHLENSVTDSDDFLQYFSDACQFFVCLRTFVPYIRNICLYCVLLNNGNQTVAGNWVPSLQSRCLYGSVYTRSVRVNIKLNAAAAAASVAWFHPPIIITCYRHVPRLHGLLHHAFWLVNHTYYIIAKKTPQWPIVITHESRRRQSQE